MIVDSGPLVAALNRREANHQLAIDVLRRAGPTAHIPEAVLIEVDHLSREHRPHDPPVLHLVDAISAGEHTLAAVDQELLEQAAALDRSYADLQLGLTDAIVAMLAVREREPVFTFDFRDFRAITIDGRSLELVVGEGEVSS